MQFRTLPVTPFQQNCTLLWCSQTRTAAVVDPGGEIDRILAAAESERVRIERILLTHGHIDHAGGAADLAERCGVAIEGPHSADRDWIAGLPAQGARFGLPPARSFEPARWLDQGDRVEVGTLTLEVLHCPGHTAGHVVFFEPQARLALVGDVLFRGSVGRSDLPGGDHAALLRSIHQRLLPLGDDVSFVPGHGPGSTLGHERRYNPFLALR